MRLKARVCWHSFRNSHFHSRAKGDNRADGDGDGELGDV